MPIGHRKHHMPHEAITSDAHVLKFRSSVSKRRPAEIASVADFLNFAPILRTGRGRLRVKLRRTQCEQMSSGLPLKADIA
jgi:hypothetical protein